MLSQLPILFPAASLGDTLLSNAGWIVACMIVVVGLIGFGLSDLRRLSLKRAWAISSVCMRESFRRRVLWITPLAILGLIVVSQLTDPTDEQDAIRQTTKFCVFGAGLVVTLTAIILASTNLPREIESRVIYTIVTKPTTRLEIVLGKVIGFARVSAAILLIMGLFTYGYLQVRAWRMEGYIRDRLVAEPADSPSRAALEYYAKAGLLTARAIELPTDLQIYMRPPEPGQPRWMGGGLGQAYIVSFDLSDKEAAALSGAVRNGGGAFLVQTLSFKRHTPGKMEREQIKEMGPAFEDSGPLDIGPSMTPGAVPPLKAAMSLLFLDPSGNRMIDMRSLVEGRNFFLPAEAEQQPAPAPVPLSPKTVQILAEQKRFDVSVAAITPAVEYAVSDKPSVLLVVDSTGNPLITIDPARDKGGNVIPPTISSLNGRYGMQIVNRPADTGNMAYYRFRGAHVKQGNATFEFRAGIEHGGEPEAEGGLSKIELVVRNLSNGKMFPLKPVVNPENERPNYVTAPAEAVAGGNFDVMVHPSQMDQWIGVKKTGLALATANRSFAFNLFKSLLILWMLSVLVVAIAVLCSTFLSWPIAIVLTLLVLLGRWGVTQLGDVAESNLGASITSGMGLDPVPDKILSGSVNAMTKLLRTVSAALPDISKFPAVEDIERGISIPPPKLGGALSVLLGYGLPVVVLSYLFLKFKEVAG